MRAENKVKPQLSPQEALIYAMVTVAAADRTISEQELVRINTMVRELPAFRGLEEHLAQPRGAELRTDPRQTGRGREGREDDRRGAAAWFARNRVCPGS